jgi:hypothetical protein
LTAVQNSAGETQLQDISRIISFGLNMEEIAIGMYFNTKSTGSFAERNLKDAHYLMYKSKVHVPGLLRVFSPMHLPLPMAVKLNGA